MLSSLSSEIISSATASLSGAADVTRCFELVEAAGLILSVGSFAQDGASFLRGFMTCRNCSRKGSAWMSVGALGFATFAPGVVSSLSLGEGPNLGRLLGRAAGASLEP
jgi:hypothetical protein